jgi:oligopeptide/dipeptide ABC transporter ATP-binding protein
MTEYGLENRRGAATALDMAPIVEVRNLCVAYFSHAGMASPAIVDVSFDLKPGEILGMLGESGSGKSTLAASLLRLLPPNGKIQQGSIFFEGRDVLQVEPRELESIRGRRIALINQEPSVALHPTMRVGDQVGEILAAHKYLDKRARRERMREVLAAVFPAETERISSSYPHQLSGGQRQRVLIAQAIACGPSVVVADEPTASLDPTTQGEILSMFQNLRQKLGLAIILITHNPLLLAGLADRVLILYAGRIAEIGPTESVLASPLHPYTRALLGCLPALPYGAGEVNRNTKLPVIPGDPPNPALPLQGCRFEPRCTDRFEPCRTREPAAVPLGDGHTVSCFKFGE